LVLSAKRKFLSVYQGLRKEAATQPLLPSEVSYLESVAPAACPRLADKKDRHPG
jgi:hypothetical protein